MSSSIDPAMPPRPFRWWPEYFSERRRRLRPQARLLGLSLVVGVIAGAGAIVFYLACQVVFHYTINTLAGYRPVHPGGEPPLFTEGTGALVPWLLVVLPILGGLASGLLVYTFAPEAEGHGTDSVIEAYHERGGVIRPRVPLVKIVASALTMGTGGSGGREGPIAQIGAGFGSYLGGWLRLAPAQRRVLMAAGMGAGIGAIFRAPLAGALFAAEVLYRSPDFESEVIIPAGLASVSAYCTFALALGWDPLFTLSPEVESLLVFDNPLQLAAYLLLALLMVVLAMLFTRTFYGLTAIFRRLPVKRHFRPAIGGGLTGLVGLALYLAFDRDEQLLSVLAFGYGILQEAMSGSLTTGQGTHAALLLFTIALGKILTTSLTIGSGGSAGVFGPSMVIGGCGGGALGICLHASWPGLVPHPAGFVLVGMAGFFAAAAKTPFSTLVMVSEMTGNYNLLLPTLWVCVLAFLLSDEQSIYRSQAAERSSSPAHRGDPLRARLSQMRVADFVHPWPSADALRPTDSLAAVLRAASSGDPAGVPIVDDAGRLLGMVLVDRARLAARLEGDAQRLTAGDLLQPVEALEPGFRLDLALALFVESDVPLLPVVASRADRRLIGIVRREEIAGLFHEYVQGNA